MTNIRNTRRRFRFIDRIKEWDFITSNSTSYSVAVMKSMMYDEITKENFLRLSNTASLSTDEKCLFGVNFIPYQQW